MRPPLLDAALEYRDSGLTVVPLEHRGKEPHHKHLAATRGRKRPVELGFDDVREEHLDRWFGEGAWPANLGILCGPASRGLVVIDIDDDRLLPDGFRVPDTPTVLTARGRHVYLCDPAGEAQSRRFLWGEVKANGYVVAPPSIHRNGHVYRWERPLRGFDLASLADAHIPAASLQQGQGGKTCPTGGMLLRRSTEGTRAADGGWEGDVERPESGALELELFDKDPETVRRQLAAIGIDTPLGKSFRSPLRDDAKPSAVVHPSSTGTFLYRDHGAFNHREHITLAELFARTCGYEKTPRGPLLAVFHLLLLVKAGILAPCAVAAAPLPQTVTRHAELVHGHLRHVIGCKWLHTSGDPTPYTREFGRAVSRALDQPLSEDQVRAGLDELLRSGAIEIVGQIGSGRRAARLFQVTPPPVANADAVTPTLEAAR